VIGNIDGAAEVVVEGDVTGATVYEATGWPVVVAFDAGGVEKSAAQLRKRLPRAPLVLATMAPRERAARASRRHTSSSSCRRRGCSTTYRRRRLERSCGEALCALD
jgi:hypothetical protein